MHRPVRSLALAALLCLAPAAQAAPSLDAIAAARFAQLALGCVHREYPSKLAHTLQGPADARTPSQLMPAFYGCYDWHSSVHGHWLLAKLARALPDTPFAAQARTALAQSLTAGNIAGEVAYFQGPGRLSFERPYGLAWLLTLARELRTWDDPRAQEWARNLQPLEAVVVRRVMTWLPSLHYPIRVGEHGQTAFAFGLIWDYAVAADDRALAQLLEARAREYYLRDRRCPLEYEPSGEDFLSACLGEADFMRRILPQAEFARWLSGFLPQIPRHGGAAWLPPGVVTDRSDPKLAHIDGLNLSRAWMLRGIASALPPRDARIDALVAAAEVHAQAALPAVTGEHYEGGHWLGTFAVYLTTDAGLPAR